MHSCVYVLITGPMENTQLLVDEAMAPFDEGLPVPPYMIHINRGATRTMAENYKLDEKDLPSLKTKLKDWFGQPGGIDEIGLFTISNDNPHGHWDWFEIGGRWDGYLHGRAKFRGRKQTTTVENNSMPVEQFLRTKHFATRLPHSLVTPTGEWISRSLDVGTTCGWFLWEMSKRDWSKRVRKVLKSFPKHRIVCIDAHC